MTPTVPTELDGSVPREVQLTGGGLVAVVTATVLAAVALGLAVGLPVLLRRAVVESDRRDHERVRVAATVSAVSQRSGNDDDRSIVGYEYDVNGRRYTGAVRLQPRAARTFKRGATLPIEYMRAQPGTSWMADRARRVTPVWVILAAGFPGLAAAAALMLWRVRQEWLLLSEGRAAQARVVSVTVTDKKRRTTRIAFEFETLSGATCRSTSVAASKPPPVGSTVPIVYHRERPTWTALYPLQLVRPLRSPARRTTS